MNDINRLYYQLIFTFFLKKGTMMRHFLALFFSFSLCILAMPAIAKDATSYVPPDARVQSSIPVGTVATWPVSHSIPAGWMPCNGQAVPAAYPQLRSLMVNVPNYNNRVFLRGDASDVGSRYEDTTRAHDHVVQPHSHTVTGTAGAHTVYVGSQSVSGTAAGQQYVDWHQEDRINYSQGYRGDGGREFVSGAKSTPSGDPLHNHGIETSGSRIYGHDTQKTTSSSSISGSTSGGTYTTSGGSVTGTALSVTGRTDMTGDSETAPKHVTVIYIIKHD